jgi:hypothetical protein
VPDELPDFICTEYEEAPVGTYRIYEYGMGEYVKGLLSEEYSYLLDRYAYDRLAYAKHRFLRPVKQHGCSYQTNQANGT